MNNIYCKWLNTKNGRYYKIILQKDMLNDLIMTCIWGGSNSKLGNYSHTVVNSIKDAKKFISNMDARRTKRGYQRVC